MTLEDFFTLTEMKDGLTAPSRVEELVSVMQKEKICTVMNTGDASRQWAAVASTLTATENKDCLDRFVQLGGLLFIDRWLKDARQYDIDSSDIFVEESIMAMLRALEKFDINYDKSVSSGFWTTIRNLRGHQSSQVQDKARVLFDGWQQDTAKDSVCNNVESARPHFGDGASAAENSEPSGEKNDGAQPTEVEMIPSRSSEGTQRESAGNVQVKTHKNDLLSQMNIDQAEAGSPHPPASSVLSNSIIQDTYIKKKSPTNSVDKIESSILQISEQGSMEGQSGKLNEFSKDEKQGQSNSNSFEKSMAVPASYLVKGGAVSSCADHIRAGENAMEPPLENNHDANDRDSCQGNAALGGNAGPRAAELKSETGDTGITSHSLQVLKTGQDGESHSDTLQGSSADEGIYEKPDSLETSFSRAEDVGAAADDDKGQTSDDGEDYGIGSDFSKPTISAWSSDPIDKRKPDIELDYGMDDALEVARKVAQEVEREVVQYRERSCSSLENILLERKFCNDSPDPNSPDSINCNDNLPTEETAGVQNFASEEICKEGQLVNVQSGAEKEINDVEVSEEGAQAKSMLDFDLNEEVWSDDMDHPVNSSSAPVSVVSALRPVVALGLPVAPLQFEGTLGWKGSAATSAFRPASPRKMLSIKQQQDCFDFDLNVAEGADEKPADLISGKASSGLHSTEYLSPRFKLDLNLMSDDNDAPPSNLRLEGQLCLNRSPSPLRNIDLNDGPFFINNSSDQGKSSQFLSIFGGVRQDEPVISIMGARVEVNRRDFFPHASNGKALEARGGFLGMGPPVPYSNSPVFGYNGLTTTQPSVSFPTGMYGAGSYMVDLRGAPIVPQILGSASSGVPPPYSLPPFIMNMATNGAGPSRPPSFNLNSGLGGLEGGNHHRDSVGLRQFFVSGPPMGRTDSQASSSSLKRKEPDSGWESYPYNNYRAPPWN